MKTYSLKRKEKSIPIIDEDGNTKEYKMYELSGKQREIYVDDIRKRTDKNGNIASVSGLESKFLNMCLKDENGNNISIETLDNWPSEMRSELIIEARNLSGLGDAQKAEEEAKNDSIVAKDKVGSD